MIDQLPSQLKFGKVVLFGSGETSSIGRKVFETVIKELPFNPRLALLETPAGFELNSSQVIGRVGEFIEHRLQNFQPRVSIIPARKRGTVFSPDSVEIVSPILEADLIFMGPGSPTYAVRQLKESLAWNYILARHGLGATLVLASSAVVAISSFALPVYEIYKVGDELHWLEGLNLFGRFGLPLVFIPHWNNHDGGDELDTSRCFMGKSRFSELVNLLPSDVTVVGIDENTAMLMDLQCGECRVLGAGGITVIHTGHNHDNPDLELQESGLEEITKERLGHVHTFRHGDRFPLDECCPIEFRSLVQGLEPSAWKQALIVHDKLQTEKRRIIEASERLNLPGSAPVDVQIIVSERQRARDTKDWERADVLREQIESLGWIVTDTRDGPRVRPVNARGSERSKN